MKYPSNEKAASRGAALSGSIANRRRYGATLGVVHQLPVMTAEHVIAISLNAGNVSDTGNLCLQSHFAKR